MMTNNEYEKMMVEAVNGRLKIEAIDAQIKAHQAALDYLNEHRRELINRYDLNKYVGGENK
ncbi:putative NinZ-like protein [Pseudomonas phage vB_PsS_LDT325]